ncbi:MAG TPA: FAD-dependent oxidoreductase [Arachidicoccus soli]|nr:FAD-dependent oxidoreductase [Arachidicoccus soli]
MKHTKVLMLRIIILFLLVSTKNLVNAQNINSNSKNATYDIVVIGGTPSGIAAAIAAGRLGKSVIIIEQAPVLGGVLSSGVDRLDDYLVEGNSGIMDEFRTRVMHYNIKELKNDPVVKSDLKDPDHRWSTAQGRAWEPKVAAKIYGQMVAEVPSIKTRFNEVPVGAIVKNGRITAVTTQDRSNDGVLGQKHTYTGRIIIDATYEGDVAAFAKVPFRIGREARSEEEPHAGKIYTEAFCGRRQANSLRGTIFPGSTGEADDKMQAFTFRFVAKDYGRADHPFRLTSPPLGYDSTLYSWKPSTKPWLPNQKADMLGDGDLTGFSTKYVLADWTERTRLEKIYKNHELGWLYYIQTKGKSPQWGLPDDEFTDNGNWPYRLYVRQGRRIEGMYTMTESDIHKFLKGNGYRGPLHQDAIAIGIYPMDSHFVENSKSQPACGEGAIHLNGASGPYQIPYGTMVPKKLNGLIVPVAISSTHVAMSSIRMESVWSSLGQAAGVAAALSLNDACEIRDVSVSKIQDILLQQKSVLFFYRDAELDQKEFKAIQKLSLKEALDGDENYYFRPEQPMTMGEFAKLAVNGLDITPSITNEHFTDVPPTNPYFKYIETLYDYSTQSTEPFFKYEVRNYQNYWWGNSTLLGPPVYAYPNQAISGKLALKIVSGLLQKPITGAEISDEILTRGKAALMIERLLQ